jgi:hypothetical protein
MHLKFGSSEINPNCKIVSLKTGFRYAQVPFKTGFTVLFTVLQFTVLLPIWLEAYNEMELFPALLFLRWARFRLNCQVLVQSR